MRFNETSTEELMYADLLDRETRRAVEVLNDSRVEVDHTEGKIRIPEEYFESDREASFNNLSNAANEKATRAAEYTVETLRNIDRLPENPVHKLGKESIEAEDYNEDLSELGFDVWDYNDSQRKTTWGMIMGSIGSASYYLGGEEEGAAALVLGAGVMAGLNSYYRGKRDEKVNNEVEGEKGLRSAYGEYGIEVKDQERRKNEVEDAVEWTRNLLDKF